MRDRVDSLGVAEPEIERSGEDQIEVDLPDVENAERAAERVGSTAQLFFYDWEKNVLDENCQTNETEINGGQQAVTGLYNAVKQASKCEIAVPKDSQATPRRASTPSTRSPRSRQRRPARRAQGGALEGLDRRREGARGGHRGQPGVLVLRDQKPDGDAPDPDDFWVIHDDPGALGHGHQEPRAELRPAGGNEPIVTFDFTDKGQKAFQQVTSEVAQRGPTTPTRCPDPEQSSQHFAIVLDNELVSVPYIDFRENPDGIDGTNGAQISGGFTITSAQDLANLLKIGALPVKLELISRSQVSATLGKQALDEGLKAGIAGFVIVALFLLIFYRVLGVIAVVALAIYALYFYALVKLIPIILTLPGIAGLILTLGVAADANIVIFERVKEEVRAADRWPPASPRATRRASRRSSTRTSSRSSSRSSSSSSRRRASRASRSRSASARSCRCSPRCSRRRRSCSASRDTKLLSSKSALGAGHAKRQIRSTSWARRSSSSRCPA